MKKKVSIVLKSVNLKTLILYKNFLIKVFEKLHIKKKIFFLPKKKKIVTLIKSPHVKKKKKESFVLITNNLMINFIENKFELQYIIKNLLINKPKSILLSLKY